MTAVLYDSADDSWEVRLSVLDKLNLKMSCESPAERQPRPRLWLGTKKMSSHPPAHLFAFFAVQSRFMSRCRRLEQYYPC